MSAYRELPSNQTVAALSAEVDLLRKQNRFLLSVAAFFVVCFIVVGGLVLSSCMSALTRPMGAVGVVATFVCMVMASLFMYGSVRFLRSLELRVNGYDASRSPPAESPGRSEPLLPRAPPSVLRSELRRAARRSPPTSSGAAFAMGALAGAAVGVVAAAEAMSTTRRKPGS